MTDPASEIYFVWAAYIASTVIMAATILYTLYESRSQKKALADLEAKGIRRRSASASSS
jgi:heme exporter protein CcmD